MLRLEWWPFYILGRGSLQVLLIIARVLWDELISIKWSNESHIDDCLPKKTSFSFSFLHPSRSLNSIQKPQKPALIVVQSTMQWMLSVHYPLARLVRLDSYYIIVSSSSVSCSIQPKYRTTVEGLCEIDIGWTRHEPALVHRNPPSPPHLLFFIHPLDPRA